MAVSVLKSLSRDDVLWRYMSLDKFVDLLSSKRLFFSPLSFYASTDPYEGYPPAVALEAMYKISDNTYSYMQDTLDKLASDPARVHILSEEPAKLLREAIDKRPEAFKKLIDTVLKGTQVSCWYRSDHQSEAMWKLYSDQHKGIAIKTTAGRLQDALDAHGCDGRTVFIGSVKYIDYAKQDLTPRDCVADGMIIPLLKRISFAHENEVRAFFVNEVPVPGIDSFIPTANSLYVDLTTLVAEVYVSPYAQEPFPSAVRAVCKAFQMDCPVYDSDLLLGVEGLFGFAK